jgi:hypothetical protein
MPHVSRLLQGPKLEDGATLPIRIGTHEESRSRRYKEDMETIPTFSGTVFKLLPSKINDGKTPYFSSF